MSNVTEALVLHWENQDSELLFDALVLHFKNHDRWFWKEVADEGLRIYNVMSGQNAERYSALDALLANVAGSAASGVFAAIAAAMGVKSSDLECAVSQWYDCQDVATPPIGLERLRQMLPNKAEPSWEHVVLGRLYHERIVHRFRDAMYPSVEPLKQGTEDVIEAPLPALDEFAEFSEPNIVEAIGRPRQRNLTLIEGMETDAEVPGIEPDAPAVAAAESEDANQTAVPAIVEVAIVEVANVDVADTSQDVTSDDAVLQLLQPDIDVADEAEPNGSNADVAASPATLDSLAGTPTFAIVPVPIDDLPTLDIMQVAAAIKANIDGMTEPADAEERSTSKPSIDGLNPSDITKCNIGWAWRRTIGLTAEAEAELAMEYAGEAIIKAGYQVTGRGYSATDQWLNFDTDAAARESIEALLDFARRDIA